MVGFQVSANGRFWATAEGESRQSHRRNRATVSFQRCGAVGSSAYVGFTGNTNIPWTDVGSSLNVYRDGSKPSG